MKTNRSRRKKETVHECVCHFIDMSEVHCGDCEPTIKGKEIGIDWGKSGGDKTVKTKIKLPIKGKETAEERKRTKKQDKAVVDFLKHCLKEWPDDWFDHFASILTPKGRDEFFKDYKRELFQKIMMEAVIAQTQSRTEQERWDRLMKAIKVLADLSAE